MRSFLTRHKPALIIVAIYLVVGLALLKLFKNQVNPDGIAYMSIAAKYAAGQVGDALNAYWGPLLPWLLVPFAKLGIDLQLAAKLIALLAGGAIIFLVWLLGRLLRVRTQLVMVMAALCVPLVLYWALPSPITPDLLLVALLLAYLYVVFTPRLSLRQRAVTLGILGAVGYFAKAFFLPFIVVHLGLWLLVEWRVYKKIGLSTGVKLYGVTLGIMALLLLPWGMALSQKYHQATLSTAGAYNFSLLGPLQLGHPMGYEGLLPPPNPSAASVWEDPGTLPIKGWSALSPKSNLLYYGGVIIENLRVIGVIMLTFCVFALAIVAGSGLLLAQKPRGAYGRELALLLSASAVYVAGYAVLMREERYFWPVFAIIILLAGVMATATRLHTAKVAQSIAIGLLAVSVLWGPVATLWETRGVGLSERQGAAAIRSLFTGNERIASDTFGSITYCWYLHVPCYGALNPTLGTETNQRQLRESGITDVLLFNATAPDWQKPAYLDNYQQVATPNPAVRLLRLTAQ